MEIGVECSPNITDKFNRTVMQLPQFFK